MSNIEDKRDEKNQRVVLDNETSQNQAGDPSKQKYIFHDEDLKLDS